MDHKQDIASKTLLPQLTFRRTQHIYSERLIRNLGGVRCQASLLHLFPGM